MSHDQLSPSLDLFIEQLSHLPGVGALTLGGSRARQEARPDSDWDFGLYYRGPFTSAGLRSLGFPGHIVEPGAWGRLMNGGGWLLVDGQRVDVLYRDLNAVEHWIAEAEEGRFEVDNVAGHIVGMPTYVLVGELSLGKVLFGSLPRPSFPEPLKTSAPCWWAGNAAFSLYFADTYAARGEVTACAGSLARAVMAMAHSRLTKQGIWALNEKRLLQRAGLTPAEDLLANIGATPQTLIQTVARMRTLLELDRPQSTQADAVIRPQA